MVFKVSLTIFLDFITLSLIQRAARTIITIINCAISIPMLKPSNGATILSPSNNIADRKLEVLLTLGAGDIDELIEPIKKKLMTKKSLIV